ncbi:tape measure protein, partial [Weissella bombi]
MADGQIDIDLVLNDQSDETWTEFKSKAETSGKAGYETFKKSFGTKPLIAKLEAQAEKEGIDNFNELLDKIPEEEKTELLAKAEKGEINSFDDLLAALPEETRTELKAKSHTAEIRSFDDLLNEVPEDIRTELKAKAERGEIRTFDQLLDELPEETRTELKAKAERGEIANFNHLLKSVPMDIKTRLKVDADRHGISNFDKLLKQLPKKTRTELEAKAQRGEIINYEKLLNQIPTRKITQIKLNDNASDELIKIQQEAEQTKHKFSNLKDVMLGTFAGNAIFKGATALTGGLESIISDLDESSKAWQTFTGNMHEFGKSDKEIAGVKKELQIFAQQSIYSASDMASTYSQLAAVGTKNTTELVKGFGGLAAASEDPKQAMKTLSQQATQMASKPKVAWEDFKLILEQSPAGMAAVAKSMGMSVGDLTQKVQNGQIATQDLFDAITKAGTSDNFTKMATSYKTVGQAVDGLREGLTNKLQGAFDSTSKVGIKMVSNLANAIDNFDTKSMMNKLSGLISYITVHSKNISGIFSSLKEIAGSLVGGAWNAAKNTLTTVANMFGLIDKNSKQARDPLKTIDELLQNVANHKDMIQALGAALIASFAVKKLSDFVGGLSLVIKNLKLVTAAQKVFNTVSNANGISILVIAIAGLAVGLVELYKHNKKFREFVDNLVDAAADFSKG